MPVLPTIYPSTPSHCPRAMLSSSVIVTGFLSGVLQGIPKDLWLPPPVSASRRDAANGLVRVYARGWPALTAAVDSTWRRSSRDNA